MEAITKTQLRGHCQCCGREQAVVGRYMSKHGYTVKGGWFQGVCAGDNSAPMEHDRTRTDAICASVRSDVAELRATADRMEAGKSHPSHITREPGYAQRREGKKAEQIAWADAEKWERDDALRSAIWGARNRASVGEAFANDLERLANEYHGKELTEVKAPAPAAAILPGERRKLESGLVATATSQVGARVYWTSVRENGKTFKSWTGTQAWRKLEKADA